MPSSFPSAKCWRMQHWFCFSLASPSQFLGPDQAAYPPVPAGIQQEAGVLPALSFRDRSKGEGTVKAGSETKAPSSRQGEKEGEGK